MQNRNLMYGGSMNLFMNFKFMAWGFVFFALGFGLLALEARAEKRKEYCQSNSGTSWDQRDPVFDNVKRVLIVVEVSPNLEPEFAEKIPKPLHKENLENILVQLYTKRYARDGRGDTQTLRCYNRNSQPVMVMSEKDIKNGRHIELAKDHGTLTVFLKLFYQTSNVGVDFGTDLVSFSLVNSRSQDDISIFKQIEIPYSLPLSATDEQLSEKIKRYIDNQIR